MNGLASGKIEQGFFIVMTLEILSQFDKRIKVATDLEIDAIANNKKQERIKQNAIKMELLDMKMFVINLAHEEIKKQLK